MLNDSLNCTSLCNLKSDYKYVKIDTKQKLINTIINYIYTLLKNINLFHYIYIFKCDIIYINTYQSNWIEHIKNITIYDHMLKIDNNFVIPYEYVLNVNIDENNLVFLHILNNCMEIKFISFLGNQKIYKKIYLNMNYHARYNLIEIDTLDIFKSFKNELHV